MAFGVVGVFVECAVMLAVPALDHPGEVGALALASDLLWVDALREADLVVLAAPEKGLSVPRDLSAICAAADNTVLSEDAFRVTSIEVFRVAVGCRAVELPMRKIAAPRKSLDSVAVPPRFREGRTIGPVR